MITLWVRIVSGVLCLARKIEVSTLLFAKRTWLTRVVFIWERARLPASDEKMISSEVELVILIWRHSSSYSEVVFNAISAKRKSKESHSFCKSQHTHKWKKYLMAFILSWKHRSNYSEVLFNFKWEAAQKQIRMDACNTSPNTSILPVLRHTLWGLRVQLNKYIFNNNWELWHYEESTSLEVR